MRKSETGDSKDESPWILIVLGSLVALGAVFPVVLSDRYLNLNDAYKAYALHPSAGAIIILLGVFLMIKLPYRKVGLIALLGFSVMTQSLNGQAWGGYWESAEEFLVAALLARSRYSGRNARYELSTQQLSLP